MKTNIKNNDRRSLFNWYALFILSLTSIITGIYRDGFASLFPFLQQDFHLSRAQLGLHSSFYYFAAASFAIYSGRVVDLKGAKWSLIFSGTIMALFYILHSIAPNFLIILILAGLTGASASFNMPSVNKGIVEWFSEKQRGTALGLQSMAFPIGGLLGAIALPFFGSILGWRRAMFIPGLMAILCALFLFNFYPERGRVNNFQSGNLKDSISFWKSISQLIKNRELLKISIFGFFLGVMSNAVTAHFTLFLFLDYGLPEVVAGLGFAFVQIGSVLGRAVWGILCDRV
ncbi:MAG: MFS transporter [Atribacterota bacterium]